jgi:hypothetical protein
MEIMKSQFNITGHNSLARKNEKINGEIDLVFFDYLN